MGFAQDCYYWLAFTPPFLRAVLRTSGQCIWFAALRTGMIEDLIVDTSQFLVLASLPLVEDLDGGEVL